MFEFLFLDLDDTILDFQKAEHVALSKTFREFGLDPSEEVLQRYNKINKAHWEALERKELTRDQVLLGSIVKGAEHSAAPQLLAFLTSQEAQQALTSQTLHTVRTDTKLYAAGVEGETESAARRSLTAINAFVSPQDVHIAAWQVYSGRLSMSEALLPLL